MSFDNLLAEARRFELRVKLAQDNGYEEFLASALEDVHQRYPNAEIKTFSEFKVFLDANVPKLIHKYILLSQSLKVCSSISPDFAEIAASKGFAVLIKKVPGHVYNIVLTEEGPVMVDLSYVQFLCDGSKEETRRLMKELYQDPFKAIKVEKLPKQYLSAFFPEETFRLQDPIKSFDDYDLEDFEETFPEKFERIKNDKGNGSGIFRDRH